MKILAAISRLFVGVLFIFSGLIKANDPLGFAYKLHDYYEVFGEYTLLQVFDQPIFYAFALETSILICILEVIVGFALLLGYKSKVVAWTLLVTIIGFTFLTGFSAITGKVTDCGCFGDAIPLTPWQSFYKDIILLVLIGVIFSFRHKYKPLFLKENTSKIVLGLATLLSIIFTLTAYHHLPFIDFRPYKAGNDVCELRTLPPDAKETIYETTFIYRNDNTGEESVFTIDNLPSDGWTYVDTKNELVQEGDVPVIKNFTLSDEDKVDITDDFLAIEGYKLLIICYDIEKTKTKRFDNINALQKELENRKGIPTFGLSASADADVEAFRHAQQTAFPFYVSDETELKTIVRSNPGLVLFDGCKIVKKWHWRDTPSFSKLEDTYLK